MTLRTKAKLKPGVVSFLYVKGSFQGHRMITGQPRLASKYGVHVANGPGELNRDSPYFIQVMKPLKKEFWLRKGIVVANNTPFEGPLMQADPDGSLGK